MALLAFLISTFPSDGISTKEKYELKENGKSIHGFYCSFHHMDRRPLYTKKDIYYLDRLYSLASKNSKASVGISLISAIIFEMAL